MSEDDHSPAPDRSPDAQPPDAQPPDAPSRRRSAHAGRVAMVVVALLVFGITGAAWAGLRYVDGNVLQVQALDPGSGAIVAPDQQRGDENFLLIGSDTRAGGNGDVGAGTASDTEGARSDTTMIAHIPADRSRVVVVSFPRDLDVDLPECRRWDNATASYTAEMLPALDGVKLNEAYAEGGPRCVTQVVQQLSGLRISHFLGIDFAGFESMVDAVGGVEVCTERPLVDANLGVILPRAGTQTIDGEQALDYVRARYVEGDPTSDYGRIQRQQRLLASLLRETLSRDTLLDLGALKDLVDAVTASTFGDNVGAEELLTLAQSLEGIDAGRVTFVTAPTTGGANSSGNEVLLENENDALFKAIREGTPLPGESSVPAPTSTTAPPPTVSTPPVPPVVLAVDPADIELVVRNGSATPGLAAEVADQLVAVGFGVPRIDNTDDASGAAVVRYSFGSAADARTVASAVPGATLEVAAGLGGTVELVLGRDVSATIVAPTPAGFPLAARTLTGAPLPTDLAVVNAGDAACG